MKQYLDLLQHILDNGIEQDDRTGTGTIGVFGYQMRFNLAEGFPLVTTKKMFLTGVIDELLWFISGSTNVNDLPERTQKWWTAWADPRGDLGRIYGAQLRKQVGMTRAGSVIYKDQLADVIDGIQLQPHGRRHVINLWHGADMDYVGLPCCHGSVIQFKVSQGKLSCQMYQRSCDTFIGLPVNIASYALLTHMIAQQCDLEVGEFIWTGGDVHIYKNHIDQVREQLAREPKPLPRLKLIQASSIDEYVYEDFAVVGYESWPAIKAEVSV